MIGYKVIWQSVGVAVVLAIAIGAAVWGYSMRPSAEPCAGLTYYVKDADERLYLSEYELDTLLKKNDVYPVGRRLDRLEPDRIERIVRSHPMVERAECYVTPRMEVRVDIYQRVPLLRVKTPIENYYIDTHHRVMPWREQIKDEVVTVTGSVGPQAASTSLAEMAEWLQKNEYWRERIHRIHMRTPQMAVAMIGDTAVVIGSLNGYEGKLAKLKTYLEQGAEATQDKQYRELDIRFRGQVIGRY